MSLTGCATPPAKSEAPPKPVIVSPELDAYEEPFERQLADELDAMGFPCPRDLPVPGCSAAKRFIRDGIHLRDQLRALVAAPAPEGS